MLNPNISILFHLIYLKKYGRKILFYSMPLNIRPLHPTGIKAKSRKYQGVFELKSRVKAWQVRGIWSQQLEHRQVPQWGTEPGVQKGKRSLLACHTLCKCSMETTHNRWRSNSVSRSWNWWKVWLVRKPLFFKDQNVIKHSWEGYFILLNKIPVSTIKLPEWRFQAFHEVSLFE